MEKTPEVTFGERLRTRREQRRWSQGDLRDRLKQVGMTLHQTQIARIELGQRALRLNEAVALARVLNVPLHELIESFAGGEVAEYDNAAALGAQIEQLRGNLIKLLNDSSVTRESVVQAEQERVWAQRQLEYAEERLHYASDEHRKLAKKVIEVQRRMDELARRLSVILQERSEDEEGLSDVYYSSATGDGRAEISIPYGDSMLVIRVEQKSPTKWFYVIVSDDGSEILRSGDFSSDDRAVFARDLVVRKILHEKRSIEELTQ